MNTYHHPGQNPKEFESPTKTGLDRLQLTQSIQNHNPFAIAVKTTRNIYSLAHAT